MKVLLAEDDFINQEVERSLLERLGCEVTTAETGIEVLEMLKTQQFDIIFMDCNMPEMDGYTATATIREQEQGGQHVPIIALTANAGYGDSERCLAAGMDAYLSKPLKMNLLQETLTTWQRKSDVTRVTDDTAETFPSASAPHAEKTEATTSLVLDQKIIARLRREMPSQGIMWLVDLYLKELPNYLNQLEGALVCQDADALYLAAHKLKGSSHSLGAAQMVKDCETLENFAKQNDFNQAQVYFEQLKQSMSRAKQALSALSD
jgi:CheY-like chemotaxis protein/HPt (histidine-containing phosphotransfer) domain-containing protein